MEINYAALGKRVKEIRKQRKISQEMLAEMIDVSIPHMSNIETGKTKLSLQVLSDLADALCVSLDVLLMGQDEEKASVRGVILEEINLELSDCTETQMTMLRDVVRNTKKLLLQYDEKIKEKK